MRCFEVIATVLDELWNSMPGKEEDKLRNVKRELDRLSENYRNISDNALIDYSDPITQFAYIFRYSPAHGDFIYQLLSMDNSLLRLEPGRSCTVVALGGGPGSDLIGCLKYLEQQGCRDLHFTYNSFDKDKDWAYCWSNVGDTISREDATTHLCRRFTTNFLPLDVTDGDAALKFGRFLNADVYTMSFFMSEVSKNYERAEPFFDFFFSNLRRGAVVAFVDNWTDTIFQWFDWYATAYSFQTLISGEDTWTASSHEQKLSLDKYISLLAHNPRLKGKVAYRLIRKS